MAARTNRTKPVTESALKSAKKIARFSNPDVWTEEQACEQAAHQVRHLADHLIDISQDVALKAALGLGSPDPDEALREFIASYINQSSGMGEMIDRCCYVKTALIIVQQHMLGISRGGISPEQYKELAEMHQKKQAKANQNNPPEQAGKAQAPAKNKKSKKHQTEPSDDAFIVPAPLVGFVN